MAKPGGGRSGRVALGLQEKSEKCVAMSMVRVKHCGPWTPEVQQPFELKDENTSTFKLVLSKSKSSSFSSFSSHSALQITRLRANGKQGTSAWIESTCIQSHCNLCQKWPVVGTEGPTMSFQRLGGNASFHLLRQPVSNCFGTELEAKCGC